MRVLARPDCHQELPDGRTNPSITAGRDYVVVGISLGHLLLVDDQGEPVLFEAFLFDVVDPSLDPRWVKRWDEDGGLYADPPECAGRGFYERWHDGDPTARQIFARVYEELVAADRRNRN